MVIAAAISFSHPVYILLGFVCASVYSIMLKGTRALILPGVLIPLAVLFAGYYGFYHHFGITELSVNFIGNSITLESLLYGAALGFRAATVILWLSCMHEVVSSDKVIYLFGRIRPRFSLILSIFLRTVPRIKVRGWKVEQSQRCIGRGTNQGHLFRRLRNFFRKLSIVITWTLDDFIVSSDSMKSRGYSLRGRTAFSIYRFDNRDRAFVIALFAGFTVMLSGVLLDQTKSLYSPEIRITPVMPASYLYYAAYAAVCLMPAALQAAGAIRFRRQRKGIEQIV